MEEIERSRILVGLLITVYALFVSYYSKDFPNSHIFQIKSFVLAIMGLVLFAQASMSMSAAYRSARKKKTGVSI